MKFLLALFMLFPTLSMATERIITTLNRSADQPKTATVLSAQSVSGQLSLTRTTPIDSVAPYDTEQGRLNERPQIIDDLYYETLLLPDPTGASETRYALIARALRLPEDNSYVIFELDRRARFQDGTPVTGADVLASLEILKESTPEAREKFEGAVTALTAQEHEVRVDLKTTGQASLDAILFLASAKIVKPNTTGAQVVGGIRVRYTVTGPYRLAQLGRARLSLIIDPSYWGRALPVRQGYFNFRAIEVIALPDQNSARMSVANDSANFFLESQPGAVNSTLKYLKSKNENIRHVEHAVAKAGSSLPAWSFNMTAPAVSTWQVRQALLLAYDFENINAMHFAGGLARPQSLAEGGPWQPHDAPSAEVANLMATCHPAEGAFESRGHANYEALAEKRVRLLTAMRLLQEAGLKLENGVLKRPLGSGVYVPMQIRMLVKEHDLRAANSFRADLARLGIAVQIAAADGDAFRVMRAQGEYELVSALEGFIDREARPSPDRLRIGESQNLPCLQTLRHTLAGLKPDSPAYQNTSEAIIRLHEAMVMSIFTGAPARRNYFHDMRLTVPENLSIENMHLYGFWFELEPQPSHHLYDPHHTFAPNGCLDLGCLFQMAPR